MTRLRLAALFLLLFALLGNMSSARAATITGIADEDIDAWSPATWSVFNATGVKQVRHIVPWDTALRDANGNPFNSNALIEAHNWVNTALAHNISPENIMISFGVNWNSWPPSTETYAKSVAAFRQEFSQITTYTAWNEPNHPLTNNGYSLNPDSNPQLAADYWVKMNQACQMPGLPACTVIGGDFSDDSNVATYMDSYKARLAQYGVSPEVWAIHPYSTAASGNWDRIVKFMSRAENKPVWYTEVGGMVCKQGSSGGLVGGSYPAAEASQAASTQRLRDLMDYYGPVRVPRTYYYFLSAGGGGQVGCPSGNGVFEFDSALLGAGENPRPAFSVIFPGVLNAPGASTGSTSGITQNQAILSGSVDPRSFHANYRFEYGTTTAYGSSTAAVYAGFQPGWVGGGIAIGGLQPGTTYHYRIVASGPGGTTYGADQTFATAIRHRGRTAFVDVTGDGKADGISVPDQGPITVRVSRGDSFAAPANWTAEAFWGDHGIFFADVTGDGKADAVSSTTAWGLLVRRSTGSGFGPTESWGSNFWGDRETFFADVTGDGRADAIAVNDDRVFVRPSTGSGFGATVAWTAEGYWADHIADVNGDGKADLIADSDDFGVLVRLSTGSGFGPTQLWSNTVFKGDKATFFADVTGDGKADAIAVKSEKVIVRPSTGTGFGTAVSWTAEAYWAGFIGDVSGDGKADLIAIAYEWGTLVRRSTGSAFGPTENWAPKLLPGERLTFFADVTGDGRDDAVAINNANVIVNQSSGSGFGTASAWTAEAYWADHIADVNGDGRADLIADSDDFGVLVRLSTGSGFGPTQLWSNTVFKGDKDTFFADVTGDGKADAIAVKSEKVIVRPSTGTSFGTAVSWTAEAYWAHHIADVNGDGRADLIADSDDFGVLVRLSTGSGFGPTQLWSNTVFKGDKATFFADVTGDGKADAIAVKSEKVIVRPSTGTGFGTAVSWTAEAYWAHYIGDVSGDGKADLIALSDTWGTLVRRSTGTGFAATETWAQVAPWGPPDD